MTEGWIVAIQEFQILGCLDPLFILLGKFVDAVMMLGSGEGPTMIDQDTCRLAAFNAFPKGQNVCLPIVE
jgi:hypothetical protein